METWVNVKLPTLEVEAVRLTEANAVEVAEWCRGDLVEEIDPEHPEEMQPGINISTPSGRARASLGMYVIKHGAYFATRHNRVFEESYRPKDRPAPPLESIGDSRKARGFRDPFGRY